MCVYYCNRVTIHYRPTIVHHLIKYTDTVSVDCVQAALFRCLLITVQGMDDNICLFITEAWHPHKSWWNILSIAPSSCATHDLITRRISPRGMVQLGYLPLTLLCGGSIHPRRYSRGVSPLPYYMTALSMREGTAGVSPPYLTAWQTSTTAACWSQSTGRILGHWSNTYCPCPRSPAGMHQ